MAKYQEKDIKEKVYIVYNTSEYKTGGSELRVASWLINGKETPARFERRDFYIDTAGQRKNGKAKGFTLEDLLFFQDNMGEILELMRTIQSNVGKSPNLKNPVIPDQQEVPF